MIFHRHYELDRYPWSEVEKEGTHVKIYVGGNTATTLFYGNPMLTRELVPQVGGYGEITGGSFKSNGWQYLASSLFEFIPIYRMDEYINGNRSLNPSDYTLVNLTENNPTWFFNLDGKWGAPRKIILSEIPGNTYEIKIPGYHEIFSYPHVNDPPKGPKFNDHWELDNAVSSSEGKGKIVTQLKNDYFPQIKFTLLGKARVKIIIFDNLGSEVATIVNKQFDEGTHTQNWFWKSKNGMPVSSGTYFYKIYVEPENLLNHYWYYLQRN